jgi:hypothetical protein
LQIRKLMFKLYINYIRDIISKQQDGLDYLTNNPARISGLLNDFQRNQKEFPIISSSSIKLEEPVWVSEKPREYNPKRSEEILQRYASIVLEAN